MASKVAEILPPTPKPRIIFPLWRQSYVLVLVLISRPPKKSRQEVFRDFRPPGGPPGRPRTIQEEKPGSQGRVPDLLGVDAVKRPRRRGSGSSVLGSGRRIFL
eukprot:6585817-Pyramimonas_sp.AAC.1